MSYQQHSREFVNPEVFSNMTAVLVKSTEDHPIGHPLSSELLHLAAKQSKLSIVWQNVFSSKLLDVKKDSVGLLFLKAVPVALTLATSAEDVRCVLSDQTVSFLSRLLSNKSLALHKNALEIISQLTASVAKKDKDMQMAAVMCILQSNVSVYFDTLTHTATVSNLIRNMAVDASQEFALFLMDIITGKQQIKKKGIELHKFAIGQLGHMITQPSMATNVDWQLQLLRFFSLHAYFAVVKTNKDIDHITEMPQTEFTDEIRQCLQKFLSQALCKCSTLQPEKGNKTMYLQLLRGTVNYIQNLLSNSSCVQPLRPFKKKAKSCWDQMIKVTHKINSESDKNKNLTENTAFELGFLQMAVELFTDPEAACDVMQDLFVCHEKAFEKKRKNNKRKSMEEPEWIEVLTELLLSLLSRPSHLMRSVVTTMFSVVCPHLTSGALDLIIQSLRASGNDEGPLDFEDEDADGAADAADDSTMETEESEASEKEEESDESGISSAGNESESDEECDVDDNVRDNVKAALGHAAAVSDTESVDLTDSEMEKLDDVLGAAFKSMQKGKKDVKEKACQIRNYKMKCLELLEIIIQNEATDVTFLMSSLEPLILFMDEAQKDKQQVDLKNRAQRVFKNLCRFKVTSHADSEKVLEQIKHFFTLSSKVTGVPMIQEVSSAIAFLVKVLLTKQSSESPSDVASDDFHSVNFKKLGKLFKTTLSSFIQTRDTVIHITVFNSIFTNLPSLLWPLLDDLLQAATKPEIKVFRKTQICGLISAAITKQSVLKLGTESWKVNSKKIMDAFVQMLQDAAKEDIKNKFVEELLVVIRKVIQVSEKSWTTDEVVKVLRKNLELVKSKGKVKDLKRACNQLQNVLQKINPSVKAKKQKKRKLSGGDVTEETQTTAKQEKRSKKAKVKSVKVKQETVTNDVAMATTNGCDDDEDVAMETDDVSTAAVVDSKPKMKKKKKISKE